MRRRALLVAAGALGLAGCIGGGGDDTPTPTVANTAPPSQTPTQASDLPNAVYVQSFRERMSMQGMKAAGEYQVGLMYAAPHEFWNVNGRTVQHTAIDPTDAVHLMATVWDPETRTVLPETGLSVEIRHDGDLLSEEVIYPMLSQTMGFHYGANFGLPGDGEYTARVRVGGTSIRRTGAFAGRFGEPASVDIPLAFNPEERAKVQVEKLDSYGKRGAVQPMEMSMGDGMGMPIGFAPAPEDLPGTVLETTTSHDAKLVPTVLSGEAAARFDAETYLAVSARTPYNGLVLPAMGLAAAVTRDGEPVFEGDLTRTIDPELNYHYGAAIEGGLEAGDEVELRPGVPPQVARHEGYERAFLEMEATSFTV
jgi:hypothetical protein